MLILQYKVSFAYDRLGRCFRFVYIYACIAVILCCYCFSVNKDSYKDLTTVSTSESRCYATLWFIVIITSPFKLSLTLSQTAIISVRLRCCGMFYYCFARNLLLCLQWKNRLWSSKFEVNKSVFSYLRTLTTWHYPHFLAARRCCSDRSIFPA